MKTGTKSLLFGVHQFLWHPITVWFAWIWLYRQIPSFKETICIIIHDWGYWGKAKMDDAEGERHPEVGAKIAHFLFDGFEDGSPSQEDPYSSDELRRSFRWYQLCLYHSRHYARNAGVEPSKLCWADKFSIIFEPWWLYLPRAWASGELFEYREIAKEFIPLTATHRRWYSWIQNRLATLARVRRGDAVAYVNPERNQQPPPGTPTRATGSVLEVWCTPRPERGGFQHTVTYNWLEKPCW